MAWVGRSLKDHEAPTPLLHTGLPTSLSDTSPGCLILIDCISCIFLEPTFLDPLSIVAGVLQY